MARRADSLTILRWVIYISIFSSTVPLVWRWGFPLNYVSIVQHDVIVTHGGYERLLVWQRIAGFVADGVPSAILVYALWCLLRLTRLLDSGDWFSETCESYCRRAGKAMFWFVLANWANRTVLVLIATATNPPGHRMLELGLSSTDVLAMIPALMALIIARMVALVRAQRNELNEIV